MGVSPSGRTQQPNAAAQEALCAAHVNRDGLRPLSGLTQQFDHRLDSDGILFVVQSGRDEHFT
jgi:hypothetical protein